MLTKTYTRGQLARACGIGSEAIRFYERQGLLPAPPRSAAGYRYYDEGSRQRLNFIGRAKALGFSLHEIGELLALHDDEHGDRARVKTIAEGKIAEIEQKLDDLQRMHAVLTRLARQCSGHGEVEGCPIIQALAGPERVDP